MMTAAFDLIVRGATVVSHDGIGKADIGVRDERIAHIGDLATADAGEVIDAAGLHVLPGVIDTQVHFREPGNEHKEDLATGTAAAALGGVTAVFEMPNTNPLTVTPEALGEKVSRAAGRTAVDHAFFMGATAENATQIAELERVPGCCGMKIFMGSSTGDLLLPDDEGLRLALANGTRRMAVHCEDEMRLEERKSLREPGGVHSHPVWRDVETAFRATRRLVTLAREAGRRVHVLHVTTAEEVAFLADNKDIATVEVTPQHLTLEAPECYDRLGSLAQMNPPIRDARHRQALWQALNQGVVDVIGTDHAPHTREEKEKAYPDSPSGMPGVQTLMPLLLDHMNAGRLSLARVMDLTSAGPQRIYGIAGKGRIAVGYDADLTLVDLKRRQVISGDWLASRSGWSPFEGKEVTGWPVGTIVRGIQVMRDGALTGVLPGKPVRFVETLR
jgi:dihydroorotase